MKNRWNVKKTLRSNTPTSIFQHSKSRKRNARYSALKMNGKLTIARLGKYGKMCLLLKIWINYRVGRCTIWSVHLVCLWSKKWKCSTMNYTKSLTRVPHVYSDNVRHPQHQINTPVRGEFYSRHFRKGDNKKMVGNKMWNPSKAE